MGSTCCNRNDANLIDLNVDKENIKQEFEELNKTTNPFYFYSLSMIEKAERNFLNSNKKLPDFINTEYSYILNAQLKICYDLVKKDLEYLIENKLSTVQDISMQTVFNKYEAFFNDKIDISLH